MTQNKTFRHSTLLFMATATGISVANLYYNQALLELLQESFGKSRAIAWIPSLTQAGYALGMLFLVPLGDRKERKKMILTFTVLSALCLALLASAQIFFIACLASFLLGLTTMAPQLLIPFAAHLSPAQERGRSIGTMMSGLLLGILLARTVSGFIGAAFGWRALFGAAAVVLLLLAFFLNLLLPRSIPSYHGKYFDLLRSVFEIVKTQPVLREACLFGALFFAAFSAFWANFIHLMNTMQLGARAVGLFGLLGAVAALATPLVGALADRRDARKTTGFMILLTFLSFAVLMASARSLFGLAIGVILMDLGVQSGHVSNQSRIFALLPEARSRIQTAYMFCYFTGGAIGSLLGALCWSHYGWNGVCAIAMAFLLLAALIFLGAGKSLASRKY